VGGGRFLALLAPALPHALSLALALCAAGPLAAQQPTPPDSARPASPDDSLSPDSLAARLERAERAIALLRQQLADESQSAVRTRSRFQLELNGRVLMNTFATAGRVNSVDVPIVALEPNDDPRGSVLGVTVRQTRLGATIGVSDVLGGTFEGSVDLDFAGGVQSGPGDRRLFPEPRLRTAWGRLVWDRTELLVGSETPLISDLNPISVASVAVTEFVAAGNLWNWLPQARLTRELGTLRLGAAPLRIGVQGAVMAPVSGSQYPGETDAVDAAERSGRPFLEGRLRVRWGDPAAAPASDAALGGEGGEIGIGVHHGWLATSDSTLATSRALSADARISLTRLLELRGEWYAGRLLRGLGGGGIGQNFGLPAPGESLGPAVRDVAGWAQLNLQAHPLLITGAGCGLDVANEDDRPTRLRNGACSAHLLWRPAQPVLLGAEYRRIRTLYASGPATADHFNLALGFEF